MKLLIFGASGRTGHELVSQALDQGHLVTAFVRSPVKLKVSHPNLRIQQGDVASFSMVESAIKGHDAVFSVLGAASPFRFDATVVSGMNNIVKAMEQEKVNRLIYMSAINVSASRKQAGPVIRFFATTLLRTETAGHETRERIIMQSPLSWTLVRSAGLTDGMHTAHYRSGENIRATGMMAKISRADVADFMLRQLGDERYVRKGVVVMI